jgi:hypothetical protein
LQHFACIAVVLQGKDMSEEEKKQVAEKVVQRPKCGDTWDSCGVSTHPSLCFYLCALGAAQPRLVLMMWLMSAGEQALHSWGRSGSGGWVTATHK